MELVLTESQQLFLKDQVASGGYLDESEVVREALRIYESTLSTESVELEAAMLEGLESGFTPIDSTTLDRIRGGSN